jgi:hypothetical protein
MVYILENAVQLGYLLSTYVYVRSVCFHVYISHRYLFTTISLKRVQRLAHSRSNTNVLTIFEDTQHFSLGGIFLSILAEVLCQVQFKRRELIASHFLSHGNIGLFMGGSVFSFTGTSVLNLQRYFCFTQICNPFL